MRISSLLVFLLMLSSVSALDRITTFVHDEAQILDDATEQQLTEQLRSLKEAGIAEVAVVTVPNLDGVSIEEYSLRLAHERLGDTEKDNGLLLLVSLEDRKYRIEVGYGLEGVLNDAKAGRIARDYLVPAFKEGRYSDGIVATANALDQTLRGELIVEDTTQEIVSQPLGVFGGIVLFLVYCFLLFFLFSGEISTFFMGSIFLIMYLGNAGFIIQAILLFFLSLFLSALGAFYFLYTVAKGIKHGTINDKDFGAIIFTGNTFGRGGSGGGGFGGGGFGGGGSSGGW